MTQPLAADLLPAVSRSVADVAERASVSLVQVLGRPHRPATGIVVRPERVLTTSHSVEWRDGVQVATPEGGPLDASVAGHARGTDLVLLRVPGLAAPPLPRSDASLRAGELVVIAGRAWSGRLHVRLHAVSSVGGPLRGTDGTTIDQVIGLPVAPYPGVSGSAILDAHGRVAAIATAGLVRGRVFGVPAAAADSTSAIIEERGDVSRGYLGVTTQPVRLVPAQGEAAGQREGLLVGAIADGSPALESGLLVGDILLTADDVSITSADDLLSLLSPDRVGRSLTIGLLRGGSREQRTVRVAARPAKW